MRLVSLTYLAENFNISWTSAECLLSDLVDKIGDMKNGQGCKDVLTAASEATEFPKVSAAHKSPDKVLSEPYESVIV